MTGREGALAGLGRATPGLSIRRALLPGWAHGGGPGANAGAAPSLPTGLIQDQEFDLVSLPRLISSPASTLLSRPLRFSCRKPGAPPRCRPLPTKRNRACQRAAPGPRTHLRRRRRARWEGARQAPGDPRAAASGADCGRRRGAGRPARSAASSSVPWSVGSGTRPEAHTTWGEALETLPPIPPPSSRIPSCVFCVLYMVWGAGGAGEGGACLRVEPRGVALEPRVDRIPGRGTWASRPAQQETVGVVPNNRRETLAACTRGGA